MKFALAFLASLYGIAVLALLAPACRSV